MRTSPKHLAFASRLDGTDSHWRSPLIPFAVGALLLFLLLLVPLSAIAGGNRSGGDRTSHRSKFSSAPRIVGRAYSTRISRTNSPPTVTPANCPTCEPAGKFKPSHFRNSTEIDNEWWPIEPGRVLVFQARSNADGEMLDIFRTLTVTDIVKEVGGIKCVVVWIQNTEDGVLVEAQLEFFAQSDRGDVWHAGEYAEEYDLGEFLTAEGSWVHGVDETLAGLLVPEGPRVGPSHIQASAPSIELLDCGTVFAVQEKGRGGKPDKFCVPAGCYREVLTLQEWAPSDGCSETLHNIYAKGIGPIQRGPINAPEKETLVLVERNRLGRRGMEAARAAALALDQHGAEVNEAYAKTIPATRAQPGRNGSTMAETPAVESAGPAPRVFLTVGSEMRLTSTSIAYGVEQPSHVDLAIFDVLGRKVQTLVDQEEGPGVHQVRWDGRDRAGNSASRGVYFIRLRVGAQTLNRTIVLVH